MRKIEEETLSAIRTLIHNRTTGEWTKANMSLKSDGKLVLVFLHGNHIATVDYLNDILSIFDGGWRTNTTKARLNVLINEFCDGLTYGVYQKNFEWFLSHDKAHFENGYKIPMK